MADNPNKKPQAPKLSDALKEIQDPAKRETVGRAIYQDTLTPVGNLYAHKDFLERHRDKGFHIHLDLNDFKHVNDTISHDAGNALITAFGKTVSGLSRGLGAKSFRPGGDEFVVHTDTPEKARSFVQALHQKISSMTPMFPGYKLSFSAGVGPSHDKAEDAMKDAKVAKLAAKAPKGAAQNHIAFHPEFPQEAPEEPAIKSEPIEKAEDDYSIVNRLRDNYAKISQFVLKAKDNFDKAPPEQKARAQAQLESALKSHAETKKYYDAGLQHLGQQIPQKQPGQEYQFKDLKDLHNHLLSQPFALLSASRTHRTPDENFRLHNELAGDIQKLGYPYTPLHGKWGTEEESYMVHGIKPEEAGQLAQKYGQLAHIQSDRGFHQDISHSQDYKPMPGHHGHFVDPLLDDNYSEVKLGNGETTRFRVNLEPDTKPPVGPKPHGHGYDWVDGHTSHYGAIKKSEALEDLLKGETNEGWLTRHKIGKTPEGKYRMYHATPKVGGATTSIRAGSLLEENPQDALRIVSGTRGLKPHQINVHEVHVEPHQINPGHWASVKQDHPLGPKVDFIKEYIGKREDTSPEGKNPFAGQQGFISPEGKVYRVGRGHSFSDHLDFLDRSFLISPPPGGVDTGYPFKRAHDEGWVTFGHGGEGVDEANIEGHSDVLSDKNNPATKTLHRMLRESSIGPLAVYHSNTNKRKIVDTDRYLRGGQRMMKFEDQPATKSPETFNQVANWFGVINPIKQSNLNFYKLAPYDKQIDDLIEHHGYRVHQYDKPEEADLANKNYDTKHLAFQNPKPQGDVDFGEVADARAYRKLHELAHALTLPEINKKYGEGKRVGQMGVEITPWEAKRALEWEFRAAKQMRILAGQVGHSMTNEQFNQESNTNMADAMHRVLYGHHVEPSAAGFIPKANRVSLPYALKSIDEIAQAQDLGEDSYLPKEEVIGKAEDDDIPFKIPPKGAKVKKEKKPPAPPKVYDPLTIKGVQIPQNPNIKFTTGSKFDSDTGTLHTPRGSFKVEIPGNEPHRTNLFDEANYNSLLDRPDIQKIHQKAMKNWFQIHELAKQRKLPDDLIAHAGLFTVMSANTPVPMHELAYARHVDAMKQLRIDPRSPEYAEQMAPGGKLRGAWLRQDKPDVLPTHSREYFAGPARESISQGNASEGTGRQPGDIQKLPTIHSFSDRLMHYPAMHQYVTDLFQQHGADSRSIASQMMKDKAEGNMPMKLGAGFGPKIARFFASMAGGGNTVVPDTHFIRHLFGLDSAKDGEAANYLKNEILWNPQNHHLLNSIDQHFLQHHPAVKYVQNKYFNGEPSEHAAFPAFWLHWLSIAPHEKLQGIGHPGMTSQSNADHTPFWDSADEILRSHGHPGLKKAEAEDPQPIEKLTPFETAAITHELRAKLGEAPANLIFWSELAPHLLGSDKPQDIK